MTKYASHTSYASLGNTSHDLDAKLIMLYILWKIMLHVLIILHMLMYMHRMFTSCFTYKKYDSHSSNA